MYFLHALPLYICVRPLYWQCNFTGAKVLKFTRQNLFTTMQIQMDYGF